MGKIMRNGKKYSGASSSMAENIIYDNTESGLEANDVQGAIDELSSNVDEQNKKFDDNYKLLWTNPKPSNDFNPSTIPLDLSTFKGVIVEYAYESGQSSYLTSFVLKGKRVTTLGVLPTVKIVTYRTCEANDTGVSFENCYALSDASVINGRIIPISIYGIK